MKTPVPTVPGMPAFQRHPQMCQTRPALPAAMKRGHKTLTFKMPIEEREEAGRYSIINPENG